jgi:putative heme-binding domain-containing protein
MHDPKVVSGLIQRLYRPTDSTTQRQLVESLARLYYREGEYVKGDWWGTRPDTSGPYYDRQKWEQTERIEKVLGGLTQGASPELTRMLGEQMKRHHISLRGDRSTRGAGNEEKPISVASVDPSNPNQIGNQPFADVFEKARVVMGDSEKGKILFTSQNCIACHTYEDGQTPKGPHLADIGKRYSKPELLESILRPSAKLAQGFESWQFLMDDGTTYVGFVVLESAESVTIRQSNGVAAELLRPDLEDRKKQETSMMPEGLVSNLTVEQLADLVAYLQSL